ncbi:26S proteasome non-ATPase regulatory subunit 4 isoform X2 [Lingula anatina]|uniref:26S proteasome non-ATPase regulatory subunit 4 n=1 Tax=Lingula anatina TaxID=7574 RepID=A0A1S3H700_LINAN|nr:26S proteasome non-ATPase regulatory subunit 4 isoform X2 [Lingula anatina]|eukprot:XP_013381757.1 26S proteasome non-ATPase regulatory subunit 4 isoform X2 [Lingula anatina]
MVLESTMVCVDNSDFMRNGDFIPTRMQAQQDAVNLVCHSKTRSNPENNVGLLSMATCEVLLTLTSDVGRVMTKMHHIQPKGDIRFVNAVRIAHLALKHRQGKNHRMRIVAFVGSPIEEDEKELVKLAKRLKKEKVNVDIVNFGEENTNTEKLINVVNTINGKDGTGSHLVTVPAGPNLSDALLSSPIIRGEDGTGPVPGIGSGGFEFGVDPNEDPELALALRVSMEEQRARQEDEARKTVAETASESGAGTATSEETLLQQALAMSMGQEEGTMSETPRDFDPSGMSEEEQIAMAMAMSLQGSETTPIPMETDDGTGATSEQKDKKPEDEDYSEVMNDPEFLQNVLENLPGVDPQSEAIRSAVGSLTKKGEDTKGEKKDESGDKGDKK